MTQVIAIAGIAGVAYLLYKFTRTGTIDDPPVRDPYLTPSDFQQHINHTEAETPIDQMPLPVVQETPLETSKKIHKHHLHTGNKHEEATPHNNKDTLLWSDAFFVGLPAGQSEKSSPFF